MFKLFVKNRSFGDCKPCEGVKTGSNTGSIPRPPAMKGLHMARSKKHLVIGIALSLAAVTALKFGRNEPRKRDYAEFYRTYDDEKAFQRMDEAGLMQYRERIPQ